MPSLVISTDTDTATLSTSLLFPSLSLSLSRAALVGFALLVSRLEMTFSFLLLGGVEKEMEWGYIHIRFWRCLNEWISGEMDGVEEFK